MKTDHPLLVSFFKHVARTRVSGLVFVGVLAVLSAGPAHAATVQVDMGDSFFSPSSLTVSPGDTVKWTNLGAITHTSTSGSPCTADGKWNSGNMSPGASFSFTFATAGSYPYFCKFHCGSGMTGLVTVSGGTALSCSGSGSPSSGPAPLAVTFNGSATGGVSPYTFAWVFGDGGSGSGATVTHTYSAGGTFTWTMTATDSASTACTKTGTITVGSTNAYPAFLATAARATGAQNTNWKTDLMLYNGGTAAVHYTLSYTPSGLDGTTTPYVHSGTVDPNGAPLLTNFVQTLFSLFNSAGSVRITSDGELKLSSRTYNDTGNGTFGQWVPGQTVYDAVPPSTARQSVPAELIGINEDADYRTNIGFSEIAGTAATVMVNVFDDQNHPLAQNVPVSLLPYSFKQMPLTDLGGATGDDLRVQLINQGPGTVLAYASVVDNRTGDAVFIPAQKDGDVTGETHQIVAVIAKATGAFNTDWVSDLYLYNPLGQTQNVTLQYKAAQGSFSAALALQADELKSVHDIVAGLFPGAGSNTSGSLQILSEGGLIIVSRTYNQTADGTFGQLVPEFNSDDPIGVGDSTHLLQAANNADYRGNIGFSEYSGTDTQVSAILYDSGGHIVASTASPVTVPAHGNIQSSLAAFFNLTASLDEGQVEVTVTAGGSVYPYLSVVDNRTGDAICVPGKK